MTAVAIQQRESKEVAPAGVAALASTSGSITELLRIAVEKGTPVEQLEKLVDLHERMELRQARAEFSQAMAAFQAECPSIKKASKAEIVTKAGGRFGYTYAELDEIARTINPIMAKHGLSYSWDSSVDKDILTCVCTVRHIAGHSITSTFTLPTESSSAMSPQQKMGAALTFAQRKSLASVMGLTTTDEDTDGAEKSDPETITDDQVTVIEDLVREAKVGLPRYLKYMNVASLSDIRAADYKSAVVRLEQQVEALAKVKP